jgi:hypothetical protein
MLSPTNPAGSAAVRFITEIQHPLESPWATAETDFVFPKTRGCRPPDLQERLRYGAALTRLAAEDPEAAGQN